MNNSGQSAARVTKVVASIINIPPSRTAPLACILKHAAAPSNLMFFRITRDRTGLLARTNHARNPRKIAACRDLGQAHSAEDSRRLRSLAGANLHGKLSTRIQMRPRAARECPVEIHPVDSTRQRDSRFIPAYFGLQTVDLPVPDIGRIRDDQIEA